MLKTCTLSCISKDISSAEVASLLASYFPDADTAVVLWEGVKSFCLVKLSAFSFPEGWEKDCLRLIVSSDCCELRFEGGPSLFACRILEETVGQKKFTVREENLMLRKTGSIEAELFHGGRGRIVHREYFNTDSDGMLIYYADRLAGATIDSEGEGK